jgi:xanthine/CO dehydrogenase XdhC/CoxF family maturation factor
MKELNDIIQSYDSAVMHNKQTALATVVKVDGSSYRRPGARMLITEDGQMTGAISGGCLEGDALRKAQFAIFQQQNKLVVYDTTDEDDLKFGVQLGCNGIVYILFEPVKPDDEKNPINLLKKVTQKRQDAMLVTVFDENNTAVQKGTCCVVSEAENFCSDEAMSSLIGESKLLLQQKETVTKYNINGSVLYQFIPPSTQLVIVGAGNDAQPLAEMAFLLGWNIVIMDGRPIYATKNRFPKASKICLTKPAEILSAVNIDGQTAVVLMTHNYNYDLAALGQLINTNCKYIGALGPKKKLHKMFNDLTEKGVIISEEMMHRIYGPVGLDIGAETSEEIALSVLSEIKSVFSQREGSSLKERIAEIHNRNSILPYE